MSLFESFVKSFDSIHGLNAILKGVAGAGAMAGRALVNHLESKYGRLTPDQLRTLAQAARDIAVELDKAARDREPSS